MKALMTAAAVALVAGTAGAQDSYTFRMPSWMWEEGIVGEWNKGRVAAFEAANPGITVDKTLIDPELRNGGVVCRRGGFWPVSC